MATVNQHKVQRFEQHARQHVLRAGINQPQISARHAVVFAPTHDAPMLLVIGSDGRMAGAANREDNR